MAAAYIYLQSAAEKVGITIPLAMRDHQADQAAGFATATAAHQVVRVLRVRAMLAGLEQVKLLLTLRVVAVREVKVPQVLAVGE